MIKAVVFDFDGTMSNRQENAYRIYDQYFRKYFPEMSDLEYEAVVQDMLTCDCNGTIEVDLRLKPIAVKYGDKLPADFEKAFNRYFYDLMWTGCVLKDETIEVLEKLKGKYKLGLLSNGDSLSQHNKINHVGISDYFDEIIVSGDTDVYKPQAAIFELMAERLGVKCEECLMVGDVYSTDILGAINGHMIPVWIIEDKERPAHYYKGYRIEKLDQIFAIIDKENKAV